MLFENPPIALDDLPQLEETPREALAPAALRARQAGHIFSWLLMFPFLALIWLASFNGEHWNYFFLLIPVWFLFGGVSFWLVKKRFDRERYALRERDLSHWRGYWWKRERTVPFARVQHIAIEQGPIQKQFGIVSLQVHTASSDGDIVIEGLRPEVAERIKAFIVQKTETHDEPA